jgi:hypothetical protein
MVTIFLKIWLSYGGPIESDPVFLSHILHIYSVFKIKIDSIHLSACFRDDIVDWTGQYKD